MNTPIHSVSMFALLAGLMLPLAHADSVLPAPSSQTATAADHITQNALAKGIYQIEYSAKQHLLYAAVAGDRTDANDHGSLLIIDPATLNINARISTQARPFGLALDDDLGHLYTSDTLDASISMFDTKHRGQLLKSVQLSEKNHGDGKYPFRPREIRLDAAHQRLYVSALAEQGRIYVLDSRTLETLDVFDNVGKKPTGLALDAARQRLFLSNGDGDVQILSVQNGHQLGRIHVGTLPLNLLYDAVEQRLFATDVKEHTVISINVRDSAHPKVDQRIATEAGPVALLAIPSRHALVVTEHDAGSVALFDSHSGQLIKRFALGEQPNSLALVPGQPTLFVSVKQPRAKDLSTPSPDKIVRIDVGL